MNSQDEITLRQYIERIMEERQAVLQLTAKTLEHRLDTLNELRKEVISDRERFLSKAVYNEMQHALTMRVERLEASYSRLVGVSIVLVALSGLIGTVISQLLRK